MHARRLRRQQHARSTVRRCWPGHGRERHGGHDAPGQRRQPLAAQRSRARAEGGELPPSRALTARLSPPRRSPLPAERCCRRRRCSCRSRSETRCATTTSCWMGWTMSSTRLGTCWPMRETRLTAWSNPGVWPALCPRRRSPPAASVRPFCFP